MSQIIHGVLFTHGLSNWQKVAILKVISKHSEFTYKDIRRLLNCSRRHASRIRECMDDIGLVEKIEEIPAKFKIKDNWR